MQAAEPAVGSFPPPGWLTKEQAAARLGLKPSVLTNSKFRWRTILAEHARRMPKPEGWSCVVYPVDLIDRIAAERALDAASRSAEGFVSRKKAIAMFNVSTATWDKWTREGKVPEPRRLSNGGTVTRTLYALADLERMRKVVYPQDKPHVKRDGSIHIPPGFLTRDEVMARFGVRCAVWHRWEKLGLITCGVYIRPWPKLYPQDEIERLVRENGRLSPPYPDPNHPGCYRVPLSGEHIQRREALVDEATLALIEAGACSWAGTGSSGHVKYTAYGSNRCVSLRRLVLGFEDVIPPQPGSVERGGGMQIGHLNDDPLDCRRENLIIRSALQRSHHRRKDKTWRGMPTSSRFKGVSWVNQAKRWVASIRYQGKNRRLGQFTDERAAALAYDEAARQWYGEHARLNFPDGLDAWMAAEAASVEAPSAEAPSAEPVLAKAA